MSDTTSTPVDKSHEAPIRDEIRRVNHAIESLQRSIGPLFDALTDRMVRTLRDEREQDAQRTAAAIAASEQRSKDHADDIHKSLELRVAAVENAIGEKDAVDIVLQDGLAGVDKRVDTTERIVAQHETWFSKNKSTIGTGAGGAGPAIAVHSAAPYLVDWVKAAIHWIAP